MEQARIREMLANGGLTAPAAFQVFGEDPVFPARFRVGETVAVAHALAASAAAHLYARRTGEEQSVTVDVDTAAATLVPFAFERIDGQPLPPTVIPTTNAMFPCAAGDWIYLQGMLPHLHSGILEVLGCEDTTDAVSAAVAKWDAFDLEQALADKGLCGARARTPEEWREHPQGKLLDEAPAVKVSRFGQAGATPLPPGDRPLEGIRVLEFARILAGPMTGRTLAEHGADVVNVGARHLEDLYVCNVATGHGKRSVFLDLNDPSDVARLRELAATCDVFVNGFRPGALESRGLGFEDLAAVHPGIVYVSVSCYGDFGPWRERRGWEQLAQMVSGMAIGQGSAEQPMIVPPGAPNDFVTGIVAAYGAMMALGRRVDEGGSWLVQASLSQTAAWIVRNGQIDPSAAKGVRIGSELIQENDSAIGRLRHLAPIVRMGRTPPRWSQPFSPRGADEPVWLSRSEARAARTAVLDAFTGLIADARP